MGADEEGTIRTLKTYMEVIADFIQQHRGRIVALGGDSVLAEFTKVVDAVRCAVVIQEELGVRNKKLPKERQMEFRIGVNLGDVVEEGDNIRGDCVNVAARIESIADPGRILISGTVYDKIKNELAFRYEFVGKFGYQFMGKFGDELVGKQAVKNSKEPVRIYRVLVEPMIITTGEAELERGLPNHWKQMALAFGIIVIVCAGAIAFWRLSFHRTPVFGVIGVDQIKAGLK
jgi:adenylate cyclase